ncbi:hypothetical protein P3693_13500 [Vibrio parahaemolyticus]|jgi:hypothetical protein|nr:hypothetical protein [Vibrio parahaemolyticus]MDF5396093.1 hypothetical protein [Vibrio parahaemolyticus]
MAIGKQSHLVTFRKWKTLVESGDSRLLDLPALCSDEDGGKVVYTIPNYHYLDKNADQDTMDNVV